MELCKGLMQQFAVEDPGALKTEVLLRGLSRKEKRAARSALKANKKQAAERAEMVETIMSGIACFFDELKMDHAGRYTHEARVAQQVLSTAIMSQAKEGMSTLIGSLVHCDRHILAKAPNPNSNSDSDSNQPCCYDTWYNSLALPLVSHIGHSLFQTGAAALTIAATAAVTVADSVANATVAVTAATAATAARLLRLLRDCCCDCLPLLTLTSLTTRFPTLTHAPILNPTYA